jgi:hypothetical protein
MVLITCADYKLTLPKFSGAHTTCSDGLLQKGGATVHLPHKSSGDADLALIKNKAIPVKGTQ